MKISAAISWLPSAQIISWLQGEHLISRTSYTQCKGCHVIACSRFRVHPISYPISCNVRRQQHAEFRARSTSTKMNYAIESDVPVVHFRKNWYQSLSFTKIYHWRVVPKNFRKKGAPYQSKLSPLALYL